MHIFYSPIVTATLQPGYLSVNPNALFLIWQSHTNRDSERNPLAYEFPKTRRKRMPLPHSPSIDNGSPLSMPRLQAMGCYRIIKGMLGLGYGGGQYQTNILTVISFPGELCIIISHPWDMTRCFTMARPSPVPPSSLEREVSTR